MKAIITHYKKDGRNIIYVDGKPISTTTEVDFPIKFGYGSYNEPMKVRDYPIDVNDIISINVA